MANWIRLGIPALGLAALTAITVANHFAGEREASATLASWSNIGGCGAGGSAGTAGAGKWIGRGATGGIYDVEVLSNKTLGGDYVYNALGMNVTHKLNYKTTVGLSLGWKNNIFGMTPFLASDVPYGTRTEVTSGFGDVGLSLTRNFGSINQFMWSVSTSLPTGQHNIKRLVDNTNGITLYMPPPAQPGSGHYTAGLTFEYTMDKDWGLYIVGGNYTAAFARGDVPCTEQAADLSDFEFCQGNSASPLTYKLWELDHNGGAPGTAARGQDVASFYAHVGYREQSAMQSGGITFTLPITKQKYYEQGDITGPQSFVKEIYDYQVKLSYGLELFFLQDNFPLFLAFGVPWNVYSSVLNEDKQQYEMQFFPELKPANYVMTFGIKGTFL